MENKEYRKLLLKQHNIIKKEEDISQYDWLMISETISLSEELIIEFKKEVNWPRISAYQTLSEEFIRLYSDLIIWEQLSKNHTLSESLIRGNIHKINWREVSNNHCISEEFIRDFQDKVFWPFISKRNSYSIDFLNEFHQKIDWNVFFQFQDNFSIMKKFIVNTTFKSVDEFYTVHLSTSQKNDLQKILNMKNLFKAI
jgi:hypothetical protein